MTDIKFYINLINRVENIIDELNGLNADTGYGAMFIRDKHFGDIAEDLYNYRDFLKEKIKEEC